MFPVPNFFKLTQIYNLHGFVSAKGTVLYLPFSTKRRVGETGRDGRSVGYSIYNMYHLKRNPKTVTYCGTKMKLETGPASCISLFHPPL
jgi:hypothetical protein